MTEPARVQVIPNGPLLVSGPVRIETPDGEVVESDRFTVAVCTCRRSKSYPLCDTSHRRCRSASASSDAVGQSNSVNRPEQ